MISSSIFVSTLFVLNLQFAVVNASSYYDNTWIYIIVGIVILCCCCGGCCAGDSSSRTVTTTTEQPQSVEVVRTTYIIVAEQGVAESVSESLPEYQKSGPPTQQYQPVPTNLQYPPQQYSQAGPSTILPNGAQIHPWQPGQPLPPGHNPQIVQLAPLSTYPPR
ncbi:hypothetical protein HK098_007093 [Nowakowskiella sp. JEL0407]|nr:hypothetical protein HK098_007093 [Nowakowskiella sp. JEL0407]